MKINLIDKIEFTRKLDIYIDLLTPNQKILANYYFYEDFSLSEIAQLTETTRSGVSKNLVKVVKMINNFEEKLKIKEKYDKIMEVLKTVDAEEEVNKIINIINKGEENGI